MSFSLVGVCKAAQIWTSTGHNSAKLVFSLWGILTFLFFVGSLSINIALQALFLLLSVVFFLLAGGVANEKSHKVTVGRECLRPFHGIIRALAVQAVAARQLGGG